MWELGDIASVQKVNGNRNQQYTLVQPGTTIAFWIQDEPLVLWNSSSPSWSHHPALLGQLMSCFLEFSTRFCLQYIVTFIVSGIRSLSVSLFLRCIRVNKTVHDGLCSMPGLGCSSSVWFWIGNLIMKKHVFFSSEPSTLSHLWDYISAWRSEMKLLQHDQINLLWEAHITTRAHITQLALAACSGESWAYMCRSTELFLLSGDGESEKIPSGQGWGLMRTSAVRQLNFTSERWALNTFQG